ncbi:MAG: hypothetical protein R3292_01705 [Alcanivorax sp.]|nr:hypothetical protein [Alcanivorax sp.]
MSLARWVLGGWLALIIIVVGGFVGFTLYTHIVVGVKLRDQAALLKLPEDLIVQARATRKAAITLQGQVDVDVPFKNDALPLPLQGTYRTRISLDTLVPLHMEITYNDEIPVQTSMKIDGDTGVVFKWLPHFPLKGEVPLQLKVPVALKVPVDTKIRFKYTGPALITVNQTIHPPVDTILKTRINLDKAVDAPVTNTFAARVIPKERSLPVVLTHTLLQLPLRNLNMSVNPPQSDSGAGP